MGNDSATTAALERPSYGQTTADISSNLKIYQCLVKYFTAHNCFILCCTMYLIMAMLLFSIKCGKMSQIVPY